MTLTSRAAIPEDAESVAEILITSRATFLPYAPSPHTDDAVRAWVRHVLLPTGTVTVALDRNRLVGVLSVRATDEATWIDQFYLHPSHVGRGIGSFLLLPVLTAARGPVRWLTFQQNTGARRFYERHGFVALDFGDGSGNEERCPDVLYERACPSRRQI